MIDGEGEVAESRGGTARGQSEVHKLLAEVRSRGAVRESIHAESEETSGIMPAMISRLGQQTWGRSPA